MKQTILSKLKSKLRKSNSDSNEKLFESSTPLWYKQDLNREQSEQYLADKPIGVFVMRKSETILDCHVLSVKVPKYINMGHIAHYLVIKNTQTKSFSVRGYQKEFHDLTSLVTHCSYMRDILPITLNLSFYVQETKTNESKLNDFMYYSSYNSKTSLHSVSSSTCSLIDDVVETTSERDLLFCELSELVQ